MWHDQVKRESFVEDFQFWHFLHHLLTIWKCYLLMQPHQTQITSYRVISNLSMLKTILNKGIWTLSFAKILKQYMRHRLFLWSCQIYDGFWNTSFCRKQCYYWLIYGLLKQIFLTACIDFITKNSRFEVMNLHHAMQTFVSWCDDYCHGKSNML